MAAKAEAREENIEEVTAFLRHQAVRDYVGNVADLERIEAALPTLDDATLSYLAAESAKANDELKAGLGKGWLVVIFIAFLLALAGIAIATGQS